jgi:prevent-host-death family protein
MTEPIETMSISEFKATCLAALERVRRSGRPLLITKRGKPIAEVVPPSTSDTGEAWLGAMRGSARITGDIIAPVVPAGEWEATSG